jgi:tRNA nucleotidyltransferase (CCA-adding enzyme)
MDAERELHAMLEASPLAGPVRVICADVREAGGKALLVGGWVRDALLGIAAKDIDVEVYGVAPDRLLKVLRKRFAVDLVGRAFGVIKIRGLPIDVSLPRRESKTGIGHTGFAVCSDPEMSPNDAARRRDFTINAMAFHPLDGVLVDPFHGKADLADRILRHTSAKFVEDPLRVLRGMQFAARFDLAVAPETVALCRTLELERLSRERIFDEWRKLVLQGTHPSLGLAFLRDCGWIRYFPELQALVGCEQEPEWHPEGDVWIHTLHCMDAFAAERMGDEWEDLVVGLAVLCHDFGKPATTRFERGRLRSPGHDAAGEQPTRSFLERMTNQQDLIEQVVSLVVHHLRPMQLYQAQPGDSAVRRLARKVRIDRLARVSRADSLGRPPLAGRVTPHGEWLLERAQALQVEASAPKPILMGRHLLALGMPEGPGIGRLLEACYEAQLNGEITTLDDAIALAKTLAASG